MEGERSRRRVRVLQQREALEGLYDAREVPGRVDTAERILPLVSRMDSGTTSGG